MQMPNGWMFDTVVFNRVVEHDLDIGLLGGVPVFATHVQRDELQQTPDLIFHNGRSLALPLAVGAQYLRHPLRQ
jgi:hypothetical protein